MVFDFHEEHEKMFINLIFDKPEYIKNIKPDYFESEYLPDIFKIIKDHYNKYKSLPTTKDLKTILSTTEYSYIPKEYSKVNFYSANYTESYAKSEIEKWIKYRNITLNIIKAADFLQNSKFSNKTDPDFLQTKIKEIISEVPIFTENIGLDFFSVNDHKIELVNKISSGYNIFDEISSGGYDPKTLIVYLGRPSIGKSIFLTNDAVKFIKNGKNVLFITAEMSAEKCMKRISAISLKIKLDDYDMLSSDINYMTTKLEEFKLSNVIEPGQLRIVKVPTSTCTVNQIEDILKKVQSTCGYKIDCLIVDYINILADDSFKQVEFYSKIKHISENLRALADIYDILVVTATQTRRGGFNSSSLTMEDVAESAALAHTADVIWAITKNQNEYDSNEYYLSLLKTRDTKNNSLQIDLYRDSDTLEMYEVKK